MFRNMLVSLLQHERIKTTLAKAKELRRWADWVIGLGKKGTLHARRQAFDILRDETIVKKLFDKIGPTMKEREGGYTRIYKLGWRQGDGAPLSLIELVTYVSPEEEKKSALKKAKQALEKVKPKKKEEAQKPKERGVKKEEKKEKAHQEEKKEKSKKKSQEE
jgi:large subunit ribosomal protein L17